MKNENSNLQQDEALNIGDVSIELPEDKNSDLMKNISLMNLLIDQIGRDNTVTTRGAVKIRLTAMIVRLLKGN